MFKSEDTALTWKTQHTIFSPPTDVCLKNIPKYVYLTDSRSHYRQPEIG